MHDDSAWIALSLLRHVGSKTLRALVAYFGSADNVLHASRKDLLSVHGVGAVIADAILAIDIDKTNAEIEQWQRANITIAPRYTPQYPPMLRDLDDEPATLFYRGAYDVTTLGEKGVAIIGTRNPSQIARQTAFQLGAKLAKQGYIIVSGLAHGIDGAAHHGALGARGGQTLAVLGSGVLQIYPKQHETLAARILQNGALLSENHPQATPKAARLVTRNRIITGLAQHVIVIETAEDGGAMHAARFATIQGKKLYTLDLPVSGNQALLEQGAMCIPHKALEGWHFDEQ